MGDLRLYRRELSGWLDHGVGIKLQGEDRGYEGRIAEDTGANWRCIHLRIREGGSLNQTFGHISFWLGDQTLN